jgi:nickel/cobalt transporter (NicO) family protein
MLLLAAIAVGFLHTLLGPDHYVPFIVIGRARRWGLGRVSLLTLLCGLGHVLSSVVIGVAGVAAGAALQNIQGVEATRGAIAGWALMLFGFAYMAWGVWQALRGKSHAHPHLHEDGTLHRHSHDHDQAPLLAHPPVHAHEHPATVREEDGDGVRPWRSLTPWILFLVFVLGPCEPLIPIFFASALVGAWGEVAVVVTGYSLVTLATMQALVVVSWLGLRNLSLGPIERWSHAVAGAVVGLAGVSMTFLGM